MQFLFRIFLVSILGFSGVYLCTASTQVPQALEAANLKLEATLLKEGRAVVLADGRRNPSNAVPLDPVLHNSQPARHKQGLPTCDH